MITTILVIVGFQIFWISENYKKEKQDLQLKANFLFKETVFQLQSSKFKLENLVLKDSLGNIEILGKDKDFTKRIKENGLPLPPEKDMVTIVNAIGSRFSDSTEKKIKQAKMYMQVDRKDTIISRGSGRTFHFEGPGNNIVQFLYKVDSLQDTISIKELDSAFSKALQKENMKVPFKIRKDTVTVDEREIGFDKARSVRVGFARPVRYDMEIGKSFGYVIKRLSSPLLFSLFLVSVTVLSFLLLFRNLQHQKKLTEIKNDFISNITHELKTPIATVGVAIEALKNFNAMNDPNRAREYLDISQNELQRLSLLVDKVLKLSMFEKKAIELKYEKVNLKELVEEVISSMRLQLEKNKAKVTVSSEGTPILDADRMHLQSVIFNMLDNALKYSKGEPSIQIEINEVNENLVMTIKDNGIGIEEEYHGKLFEKFFRVPTGNTHDAKGYGLGLSYVAHVVQRHKGEIKIQSEPGIGTVFKITLPKKA